MEAENHFSDERSQGSLAAAATAPFWYSPNHEGNTIQTRGQQGSLRQAATSDLSRVSRAFGNRTAAYRAYRALLATVPQFIARIACFWNIVTHQEVTKGPSESARPLESSIGLIRLRQPSEPRGHKGPLADETKKHLRSLMLKQRSQGTLEKARATLALRSDRMSNTFLACSYK